MYGKHKCEILKSIRKTIADLNGIEYDPEPCNHEGDCMGTCPRCDQETSWLMDQLRKKEAAGSPIRIDVESIEGLEQLVSEPCEDEDDEKRIVGMMERTPGIIAPPEPEELNGKMMLQGDIAPEDEDSDDIE